MSHEVSQFSNEQNDIALNSRNIGRGNATETLYQPKLICHKNDHETSFAAAEKMIKSGALNKQEQEVLGAIDQFYYRRGFNFTAKGLSHWSGLDYHIIQRRLSGLCLKGKIDRIKIGVKPDGNPVYKKRDGCCVWRIVRSKS